MSEPAPATQSADESIDYHIFNTNAEYLDGDLTGAGVYGRGIVAAFANSEKPDDVETYGNHIAALSAGDRVLSYQNGYGIRAVGFVLEDGGADPVPPEQKVFHAPDDKHVEFHAPVHWTAVLPPERAISPDEIKQITESPAYTSARRRLNEDSECPQLLVDIVLGRANRL